MKTHLPVITLRHLLVDGAKCIGLQFFPSKPIQALIKTLENPRWSAPDKMVYIANTQENIDSLFATFKGIAWINCRYFYKNRPVHPGSQECDLSPIKERQKQKQDRDGTYCPKEYIELLELKRYSYNTAKTYVGLFSAFVQFHKGKSLIEINEMDIRSYVHGIVKQGKSISYQNQVINAIKFYYEQVLDMPQRFYEIERPRKQKKLPTVLSKEEIGKLISVTENMKHRAILLTIYSSGIRLSELLGLKLTDIQSDRHLMLIRDAKGMKDRNTLLSEATLQYLRKYYKAYRPKVYLFEGAAGKPYSAKSVQNIVQQSAKKAGITKSISPHTLRHSFATHLLESNVDLRYIQSLLGHGSSVTTEIYAQVSTKRVEGIRSPADNLGIKF